MRATERVQIYGSLGLRKGISDLLWSFRKSNRMEEFPSYLDDHPFQVMDRIKSEQRFGIRTADVVIMPHYAVMKMGREGLLSGFQPREASRSALNMPALGSGATPIGVTFMAMAYNTKTLKSAELPDSLGDLAHAALRGALGTQSLTSSRAGNLGVWYLSFLHRMLGGEEWRPFVESLAKKNRPAAYDCIDHLLQGLLEGEVKLGLTVYSLAYFREKSQGSPISLLKAEGIPHMMTFTSAALLKQSDQNESARKFMEFLLTPEAQKIIGGIPGIAPVRRGLKPGYDFEHSYGVKTAFHPDARDFDEMGPTVDLFRGLGLP